MPPAFHPEIPVFCGTRPPGEVFQSHAPSLAVLLPPLPKMRLPMNQIKLIYYLQGRAPKRKAKLFCVYRTKPSLTFKPSIRRKSFYFLLLRTPCWHHRCGCFGCPQPPPYPARSCSWEHRALLAQEPPARVR